MNKIIMLFVAFILIGATFPLKGNDYKEKTEWLKEAKFNMTDIVFYGKVIDQYEKPVPNAIIHLRKRVPRIVPGPDTKIKLQTDIDGLFEYKNGKGGSIYFDEILKDGYIAERPFPTFNYSKNRKPFHIPDPKNPVIFRMRKKGENPTYLMVNSNFDFRLNSGDIENGSFIDLKRAWERNSRYEYLDYEKDFLERYYDIKIMAIFDKNKSDWKVTITANGEKGGFILDDNFLSEAPSKGYKNEFVIIHHVPTEKEEEKARNSEDDIVWKTFNKRREFPYKGKYLYIKSREPVIYSRVKLADGRADNEKYRLYMESMTNPYGEKNLELMDVPYGMGKYFYPFIIEAFLENKRPKKPNIEKIWEKFKIKEKITK